MTKQGHDYIVVIEFYSEYPNIVMLERKTAAWVMLHIKSMFARHGIPGQLVSDDMSFASREFNAFVKVVGDQVDDFEPDVSTFERPKRTRCSDYEEQAEEGERWGSRPLLGTTDNTAVADMSYSPAQLLMSRNLNTKVPTLPSLLQPKVVDARPQLDKHQQRH